MYIRSLQHNFFFNHSIKGAPDHTRLSPRLGGRLNLGGAVWAVKLICMLLVEKSCLAFFKICLKIHFYTSNLQISFTAQMAQPKFSLPPRRGLKLVCVKHFEPYLFLRKELSKFLKYDY